MLGSRMRKLRDPNRNDFIVVMLELCEIAALTKGGLISPKLNFKVF